MKYDKSIRFDFFGLLTLLFIGLKLTGYINWSWVWVLGTIAAVFVIGILLILFKVTLGK